MFNLKMFTDDFIRAGEVFNKYRSIAFQYLGSWSNLNLFFDQKTKLNLLSDAICNGDLKANITWENIEVEMFGTNVKEKEEKEKRICDEEKQSTITLPFSWDLHNAMAACKVLGRGQIYTMENPGNLTDFDFEYVFGETFHQFIYFWTPFNDVKEEGVYRNEYNGQVIEVLHWYENQPNGGTEENFVTLGVKEKSFIDSNGNREQTGLACSVTKEIITLRGGCKGSFLGNIKQKLSYELYLSLL